MLLTYVPGEGTDTPKTALVTGASSGTGYELTKLAEANVTVTAPCPGGTDTGFFDRSNCDESGAAEADRMSRPRRPKRGTAD